MKNISIVFIGFALCATAGLSDGLYPAGKIAKNLSSVVAYRPLEYRLVLLHIPPGVSIDEIGTGTAFGVLAPYQVTISPMIWEKQLNELLEILQTIQASKTDTRGDYRWGIEIVGAWGERPITVYLDKSRNLAEINGVRYVVDKQLSEWLDDYVAPVMLALK